MSQEIKVFCEERIQSETDAFFDAIEEDGEVILTRREEDFHVRLSGFNSRQLEDSGG